MKHYARIRWYIILVMTLLGALLAPFAGDSGRFTLGLCIILGFALSYIWDNVGERFLFGKKLAQDIKEARSLLRASTRLLKRARASTGAKVIANLEQSRRKLSEELLQPKAGSLTKAIESLAKLTDAHLLPFRKAAWREYFEPILMAAAVALLLRGFVVEPFKIPSGSMIPTLYVGDQIFVNKLSYGLRVPFVASRALAFGLPDRGEIAVFKYPLDPEENFVKRVVGLPGDELQLIDGVLLVNGKAISRQMIGEVELWDRHGEGIWFKRNYQRYEESQDGNTFQTISDPQRISRDFPSLQVPEGYLFAMGDNRDNSSDSREWGFVPADNLVGRAMFIWWSWGPGLNTERFFSWVN